jgi:hypothetical protein
MSRAKYLGRTTRRCHDAAFIAKMSKHKRKDLRRLFTECQRGHGDCCLFNAGKAGGAGFGTTRVGGIVGRCTIGSFYGGQCGGTVEPAEARSVAGLCFGQAETHAEDARLAWHVIVNIEQHQFFNAPLTLAKRDKNPSPHYEARTTLRRDLCTCKPSVYSMNPSFLNLFRKKLTRDRVVPIISASVS